MSIRKEQKEGSAIIYLIDEENRTVTAKISKQNLWDTICHEANKYEVPICTYIKYPTSYFVGVAKCAPEDKFDIETGKRLAAARMLQKYYKAKLRVWTETMEWANTQMNNLEDLMNSSWLSGNAHLQTEKEIIAELSKDN